jgi:hypothetical protein
LKFELFLVPRGTSFINPRRSSTQKGAAGRTSFKRVILVSDFSHFLTSGVILLLRNAFDMTRLVLLACSHQLVPVMARALCSKANSTEPSLVLLARSQWLVPS